MARMRQRAPEFAKRFASLIREQLRTTRRGLATTLHIDPAAVNRLCTSGRGSEENICKILIYMHLKPRRILELLSDRRAELCEGDARAIWKNFRYAFPNDLEYMAELCPIPLDRVCACTHVGISIRHVVDLARAAHIKHIEDLRELKPWQIVQIYEALTKEYDSTKVATVFSQKIATNMPLVAHLDTFQRRDAADYAVLENCHGTLLFGMPHVVLTHYVFEANGKVERHCHAGGVEFLYSEEGAFELECKGIRYPRPLADDGSVIVLHAKRRHSIRLAAGEHGRLLVVRYDPRRRVLPPGPTLREREDRKRKRQHNPK